MFATYTGIRQAAVAAALTSTLCVAAAAQAWEAGHVVLLHGTTSLDFIALPPGTFTMGSPTDEPGRFDRETPHVVTLTQGFYLQATELTQAQWEALMRNNPAHGSGVPHAPIEQVSWLDAIACANALSEAQGLAPAYDLSGCSGEPGTDSFFCSSVTFSDGATTPYACTGWRLPTEAEWEYAYRAGTQTAFPTGPITQTTEADPLLDQLAWNIHNSGDATHIVATRRPNPWGLYDMAGNVWEWVADGYGDYPDAPVTDPFVPFDEGNRVTRGGSFGAGGPQSARAAYRNSGEAGFRDRHVGFRLARSRPKAT